MWLNVRIEDSGDVLEESSSVLALRAGQRDDSAPRPVSYIGGSVLPRERRGFESVDFGAVRRWRRRRPSIVSNANELMVAEKSG